ncbi:hypothetical protein PHYSODRAFT_404903, partial [Phytophthora sojae]
VEIGYTRGWGLRPGQLDWKADQWAAIPGVNYKLHGVLHRGRHLPRQDPIPILQPHTIVTLDSRLLLGLAPRVRLPTQPPIPARIPIDLYAILEYA